MDVSTYTDDELESLRVAVATEQERRANLAAIPEQIALLARTFRDGGGDEGDLTAALDNE